MKSLIILIFISISLFCSSLLKPLPLKADYHQQKAKLGKKLFFDNRLSKNNSISCASCHDLYNGGDDGLKFSFGIDGKIGNINSPTVLNSRYNFVQFYNGKAQTLKDQAAFPIQNPIEMGSKFENIIIKLKKDNEYIKEFNSLYKQGISKDSILDALSEFEKSLITPSRYDKYLRGDKQALTSIEKEGLKLFKKYGCISCHNGINLGSNIYQKLGLFKEYKFKNKNLGLYDLTKNENDKYYFKVPTLRNIELTSPYFHGGDTNSLKEAIAIMGEYQLGIVFEDKQIIKIEAFLKSLTGQIPEILKEN